MVQKVSKPRRIKTISPDEILNAGGVEAYAETKGVKPVRNLSKKGISMTDKEFIDILQQLKTSK
jgi:hypothetical protein